MKKRMSKRILAVITVAAMSVCVLGGCGSDAYGETAKPEEKIEEEATEDTNEDASVESGENDEAGSTDTEENAETEEEDTQAADSGEQTAHSVVEDMVFGWSLGNSLDAYIGEAGKLRNDGLDTETGWGNPKTTQATIDEIKSTGINVIRIPVTWYTHVDPDTYEIDEAWMNRVAEVVDYALDDDTYVILNVHHDTGDHGWLKASDVNLDWKKEVAASFWKQIATRFNEYPDHLLFEGFNEILDDNNEWTNPSIASIQIVNDMNQIFVDTVRETGGNNANRILIVNSYCAGTGSRMLGSFKLPTDTREDGLIVEVHGYSPYSFCAPEFPNDTNWSESDVDSMIKGVHTTFVITDTPVIIGEFGAVPKGNDEQVEAWATHYLELANGYGIKCMWWDNGIQNEYAIFDRATGKATRPELLEKMLAVVSK